ncbi:hypothetical protein Nepgr_026676 [Nepenthes gracilis]|uniref:Uncharacterized protein n=1 Tax=Nepenthes gracilis TaxID=150966 RepID=A0AAD3T8K8_NEPGR|nr:hypothetical protein Nepgr_026676 [Nepenthes gracilis]
MLPHHAATQAHAKLINCDPRVPNRLASYANPPPSMPNNHRAYSANQVKPSRRRPTPTSRWHQRIKMARKDIGPKFNAAKQDSIRMRRQAAAKAHQRMKDATRTICSRSTNPRSSNLQASAGTIAISRSSREYISVSAEYRAKTYFPMSLQPQAQLQQQRDTRHQKPTSSSQFNPRRWLDRDELHQQQEQPTKKPTRQQSIPNPAIALHQN